MTYEQLIQLQNWASLIFLILLGTGAIQFVVGLIRPAWVRRAGRGTVILTTLGIWIVGFAIWAGAVGYTHSHPNGPHSVTRYIDEYFAEQCANGADLPACHKAGPAEASQPAAASNP